MAVVDSFSSRPESQAPWWVLLLVVLTLPFAPLVLMAVGIPGVVPRLAVLAVLAIAALVLRVAARQRRPRSLAVFVWLVPYGLMMWAGWSAAGWAEAIEYRADCNDRWDNGSALTSAGYDRSNGKAAYLGDCIRAQRVAADERSRQPDARCVMMEDSSGCPDSVLRRPWLALSGAIGAVGLAVTLARWATTKRVAPTLPLPSLL